jgi:hypothetical protein
MPPNRRRASAHVMAELKDMFSPEVLRELTGMVDKG